MTDTSMISIQLYSLRNFGDLDHQLDIVAQAGYRNVETVQYHLDDAEQTRRKLGERGLAVSSAHVGMMALRERLPWVIAGARTIGTAQLFMPAPAMGEREGDAAHWHALGRELGEIGARLAADGIRLGYHNHHWELAVTTDGRTALEHLFEGAAGFPLDWQVDVAWLARGGANPSDWLVREKARIVSAHVKDIARPGQNEDEDGWCDVGSGTLDWPRLWRECRMAGAKWMVVEHDNPKHGDVFARKSFEYLRTFPTAAPDTRQVGGDII